MTTHKSQFESILVTGGAGFIGTHLSRRLIDEGHRVVSLDLKGLPESAVEGVQYTRGDARDQKTLEKLIESNRVTAVYHLAATVSVPLCQGNPLESYSHNVGATLAVLEACRAVREARDQNAAGERLPLRFAFASSAALYGNLGDDRKPLSEDRIADRFLSFYAAQKHASEKLAELYQIFHKIPALNFRFFNVYGKGQDPTSPYSGVITVFTRFAREGSPIPLNAGGIQTRDFIPVQEVARALTSALSLPESKWNATVMNLGTGTTITIRQLAEMIREISCSNSPIIDAPPREGDVIHSLADTRRAEEILGFKAEGNLSSRLEELLLPERAPLYAN